MTWVVLSIRREMETVGAQAEKIEEKRIEEWLNENECTTLVEGLYLLCNGLCLLLLYYNQMIIMPMNLLDCICLDTR